jgi:hypothetical protein
MSAFSNHRVELIAGFQEHILSLPNRHDIDEDASKFMFEMHCRLYSITLTL